MKTKTESLPVIFRRHYCPRMKEWSVTACFPTLPADCGSWYNMVCYAHVGQHGGACPQWFLKGRLCKPEEYADLLSELRGIYETDHGDGIYILRPVKKETYAFRRERENNWNRSRAIA